MFDGNWTGNSYDIPTGNSIEGHQYSFVGSAVNEKASWIAFNLPTGTVMTMLENPTFGVAGQPYNFAGAGRCVDLIGNGQLQTVDLSALGANDCLSAYIWRQVSLIDGVFQMFDNTGYQGNRNTFFLCEWAAAQIQSLAGWWINDKAASVYFSGLTAQSFTMYENADGSGQAVSYAGWLTTTQIDNMGYETFNDKASSWSWSLLTPLFATIAPFTINPTVQIDPSLNITSTVTGVNQGNTTITDKVIVTSAKQQALTVSVTKTAATGYVEGFKYTNSMYPGHKFEISCSFNQTYTNSSTNSTTQTTTQTLTVEQDISVPANCDYQSTLVIEMAAVPQTSFSAQGTFYYTQPVPGSTLDQKMTTNLGQNVYVLSQIVTGFIGGGLAAQVTSSTITTPITTSEDALESHSTARITRRAAA
jgi:hypothetical protein